MPLAVSIELPPPIATGRRTLRGTRRAGVDQLDARVRFHAVEDDGSQSDPRRLEAVSSSRRLDAWVGDEQRPAHAEQPASLPSCADRAQALHQARRALVGAKCVFQHFF
jgi:hypothetical protein